MTEVRMPKRRRQWRRPTKYDPPPPTEGQEAKDEAEQIDEGINDLMNLDPSVIQNALIERGYHPGITRALDHNYCVFLLRECQTPARSAQKKAKPFTSLRSARQRKTKGPLFASPPGATAAPTE
jgi:hypothetical protein